MGDDPLEQGDADDVSLKQALLILKDNAGDYLAARRELLQIEAKEASYVIGKKVAVAIFLAVVALFSYFLFWFLVIFGGGVYLDRLTQHESTISYIFIIALAVLVIHLIVIFVLVNKLKKKSDLPLFEMTKAEFNNDKQWLEENK